MGGEVPLLPLPPPEVRRKLRDQMGFTLAETAAGLEVSPRTLLRWEWGDTEPTPKNHRKYHALLKAYQNLVDTMETTHEQ
jgi:DNA-binding transcriptional regulator YiaG